MGPAAGETAPSTGSVSGRYTFHLPNGWSRRPLEDDVRGDEEGIDEGGEEQQGDQSQHRNGLYKPLLAQSDRGEPGEEGSEHEAQQDSEQRHSVPVGVLGAFCIMGAAVLLPFNSLVTPSEYYRYLLADSPRAQGFMSWVVATFNVSLIAAGALATISMHTSSPVGRIYYSAGAIFVSLLVLTLLTTKSNSDSNGDQSASPSANLIFAALLALTLLIASATAYLQTAVVALCSVFGRRAMGLMLSGQGLVGLVVSIVQLVAAVSKTEGTAPSDGPEDQKQVSQAATVFFAFSTAFMAFAIATFTWLARLPVFRKTCRGMGGRPGSEEARENEDIQETSSPLNHPDNFFIRQLAAANRPRARHILAIQSKIRGLSFAIFYTFTVTLAAFPALTARVISTDTTTSSSAAAAATSWKRPLLFVAWHFVIFNGFDLAGRLLPSISPTLFLIRSPRIQVVGTLARTAFIPLLLACNVRPSGSGSGSEDATTATAASLGDGAFFFLVASLALSNGLMSTGVMVSGPSDGQFTKDTDRATVGAILNFWLGAGLAVGSFASFAVGALA